MKTTIIFDLGNTLVRYFNKDESYYVSTQCINNILTFLKRELNIYIDFNIAMIEFEKESYELNTYQVRPLHDRLIKSFKLDHTYFPEHIQNQLCISFLEPIFKKSKIYDDSLSTIQCLRNKGFKLAIISNMPWGSPSEPWRQELKKFGILQYMDTVVFCSDIGWRKPSPKIFEYTLSKLDSYSNECIFIGDSFIDDIQGAKNVGIESILINRIAKEKSYNYIKNLSELKIL